MTGRLRRLLLSAGHDEHCRARMQGLAAEVRAVQEWAEEVEQTTAARLAEAARKLQAARAEGAAQERRNRDTLLDQATAEAADLKLEVAILRTRLAGGDRTELLMERETNRILEQRNATLWEENEALKTRVRT
uniref:hypothetical protein n=1 Tax=Streptosporangium sp. CA-235898 TaxID=3240073 RepID=UPI003F492845